ncbi:MAG: PEGA domain-containing protein, partial [Polyangiaceae bacterium]|nr:PEGA domain-containing protein [Polyangiaceae bacterium]
VSVNGATVSVDGRAVGISPIKDPVFVDPGKRTIDVTLDEYTPSHKTVDAAKGSSQSVKILMIPKPKTPPPPISAWRPSPIFFIVGGSITIAGLGAGVVMTAIANGKSSDADSLGSSIPQSGCYRPSAENAALCTELKETLADQGLFARAAVGSFAVAGIFAVGTGALMLYAGTEQFGTPKHAGGRSAASSITLVPVVDSAQKGLLVVGTF